MRRPSAASVSGRRLRRMSTLRSSCSPGFGSSFPSLSLFTEPESIALSIGGSPTHAHPRLAEGGLIGKIVEDVTSAADHAVEHWRSRKEPEGS